MWQFLYLQAPTDSSGLKKRRKRKRVRRKAQPCLAVGGVRSNIVKRASCFSLLKKDDPLEQEGRRLCVSDRSHPTGGGRSEEEERARRERRRKRRKRSAGAASRECERASWPTMSHCRKRCKRQLTKVARFFYRFLTGTLTQGRRPLFLFFFPLTHNSLGIVFWEVSFQSTEEVLFLPFIYLLKCCEFQ